MMKLAHQVLTKRQTTFAEARVATFSTDQRYRYLLSIVWDDALPLCQFVGLNPSTADEMKDDPTVRRCKRFASSFGCGGLIMTNIFAYRATDPKDMIAFKMNGGNPIGETFAALNVNNQALIETSSMAKTKIVIAAWGVHGRMDDRGRQVAALIGPEKLHCLGTTMGGYPKHPLYLKKDLQPVKYWPF